LIHFEMEDIHDQERSAVQQDPMSADTRARNWAAVAASGAPSRRDHGKLARTQGDGKSRFRVPPESWPKRVGVGAGATS
jgi:hypothetical protein